VALLLASCSAGTICGSTMLVRRLPAVVCSGADLNPTKVKPAHSIQSDHHAIGTRSRTTNCGETIATSYRLVSVSSSEPYPVAARTAASGRGFPIAVHRPSASGAAFACSPPRSGNVPAESRWDRREGRYKIDVHADVSPS